MQNKIEFLLLQNCESYGKVSGWSTVYRIIENS